MQLNLERRSNNIVEQARLLSFEGDESVESIVLELDTAIRQTAELAALFSIISKTEESKLRDEIQELKNEIRELRDEIDYLKSH